jgi:hypothetical protein
MRRRRRRRRRRRLPSGRTTSAEETRTFIGFRTLQKPQAS